MFILKTRVGGSGWYASSATERKEHVESISLVEGGQLSFYAENIPFSSSSIFSGNAQQETSLGVGLLEKIDEEEKGIFSA